MRQMACPKISDSACLTTFGSREKEDDEQTKRSWLQLPAHSIPCQSAATEALKVVIPEVTSLQPSLHLVSCRLRSSTYSPKRMEAR